MNTFVTAAVNTPDSLTENGAATFASSNDALVDFFFKAGASRGKFSQFKNAFDSAMTHDEKTALRCLLWSRDAREGAGERENFRQVLKSLATTREALSVKIINSGLIENYGRWDDYLVYLEDGIPAFLQVQAASVLRGAVVGGNGLVCKWMPRKGQIATKLRGMWGMSPKQYRKTLVTGSNTVEQLLCAQKYDDINFAHVPSVANTRYAKAFKRHTPKYEQYLESVKKGDAKINVSVAYPYDVIRTLKSGESDSADVMWNALPDYVNGKSAILPIIDVSGSMDCKVAGNITAMDIAISLGIYTTERQEGPFKNLFLTFNTEPQFVSLTQCNNIAEKYHRTKSAPWGGSTDLQKSFDLVLATAVQNKVSQEDMPKFLLLVSDMEFNQCEGYSQSKKTNFQVVKAKFAAAGYEMPQLIFWNVNSRTANVPVRFNEQGVALVSGFSPAILKSVLDGDMNPLKMVMKVLMQDRYSVEGLTV